MVPPYHYVNNSINFVKLNDLLEFSAEIVNSFLAQVQYSCSISPFLAPTELIASYCDDLSKDFVSSSSISETLIVDNYVIGSVWLCPGLDFEVKYDFHLLLFSN